MYYDFNGLPIIIKKYIWIEFHYFSNLRDHALGLLLDIGYIREIKSATYISVFANPNQAVIILIHSCFHQ